MSTTLQLPLGITGRTVRARIWSSAGTVWNGSAFVSYVAANVATYDVTMTALDTSGRYQGTFPATIPAGVYSVEYRDRTGGGDLLTGAESLPVVWNGSAIVEPGRELDEANGLETGVTIRAGLKLVAAILAGKRSNAGTTTEQFDAVGNPGTARVVGNLNAAGNGTPTLSTT